MRMWAAGWRSHVPPLDKCRRFEGELLALRAGGHPAHRGGERQFTLKEISLCKR